MKIDWKMKRKSRVHPTAENLQDYLKGSLAQETEDRVRLHLAGCIPCLRALDFTRDWLRSQGELPGSVVIPFPALKRVRGFVAGPELALAAMGPSGDSSEVVKAEGDPSVVGRISIEGDGCLMGAVERESKPLEGASLSLELVDPEGNGEVVASGETDEHGEAVFGPAEKFEQPPFGWHYRLRVVY